MKRINELNPEDAKILLQSQPLSSALWLASTDQPAHISYRLPDPAFADSKNWSDYMKKEKLSSLKSNDSVDYIKVSEIPAIQNIQAIPIEVEPTPKVVIENKALETESITELPQAKAKQASQSIKRTQHKPIEAMPGVTAIESPITVHDESADPVSSLNSKRISKNLDFYQWLEELHSGPKTVKRQKTATESKLPLKTETSPASETRKVIESSLTLKEEVISETLAKLLARQGHKQEAIAMYEKLMLKFPEKGSTFATAIEKLKT
ncbi:MAG: hypothetical protein IPK91_15055 [Saprospiraceae bacterium]|nr:hypothetical protein [Saprospiraceae bacterium]